MKLPPTVKPIPPPKIDTPTSPPKSSSLPPNGGKKGESNSQTKSPPPLSQHQQSIQSPKMTGNTNAIVTTTGITGTNSNDKQLQIQTQISTTEIETTINRNDESNYAVTEL